MTQSRTWNTPVREPWNSCIHHILKAIDTHNAQYFKDHNEWHLKQAELLRQYVVGLKNWILMQEQLKNSQHFDPGEAA